jgi:hypothetical protein
MGPTRRRFFSSIVYVEVSRKVNNGAEDVPEDGPAFAAELARRRQRIALARITIARIEEASAPGGEWETERKQRARRSLMRARQLLRKKQPALKITEPRITTDAERMQIKGARNRRTAAIAKKARLLRQHRAAVARARALLVGHRRRNDLIYK